MQMRMSAMTSGKIRPYLCTGKRNNRENLRLCTRTLYPYALEYLQSRRRSLRLGYQRKVEKVIQGALDRGMRLSFRVVVDSRDRKNEATPAYVFDAGAKYYTDNGKRSPYPDDPIFQEKYAKFIEAFAQNTMTLTWWNL